MSSIFKSIEPQSVSMQIFEKIDQEWMLITAGNMDNFNTMTASWGTMGTLWHRPIAICFIRPQRYTYEFMENNLFFTLSFFPPEHRKILSYCGAHSGRNTDKIADTGLIPYKTDKGNISYEQASLFFECRKIYFGDIKPGNFLFTGLIDKMYPTKDFHRFYIGEIINAYQKE